MMGFAAHIPPGTHSRTSPQNVNDITASPLGLVMPMSSIGYPGRYYVTLTGPLDLYLFLLQQVGQHNASLDGS